MGSKEIKRVKRIQRDYPLAFKLSVIEQIEEGEMTYIQAQKRYGIQGRSTALTWLRKHGKLDWSKPINHRAAMPKSKKTTTQKMKRLEKALEDEKLKNFIYGEMVDLVHREYGIDMRKKYSVAHSGLPKKKDR